MKYIVMKVKSPDGMNIEVPIIFPTILVHSHMADKVGELLQAYFATSQIEPVSAGELSSTGFDPEDCYGRSNTLKLESRGKEDGQLIMMCDYGSMHK